MKNPICISTGFVYKISEDMNEKIRLLKQFSADGIELNFASSKDLINFKITQDNLEYLKNKRITIHAPWKDIIYGNNLNCINTLNSIQELYNKTNALLVNLHKRTEDDLEIFKNYNFIASIENEDWRTGINTPKGIDKILMENTNLGFTFDFAHALTVSPDDIPIYVNQFKNRIVQVHLSYLDKNLRDHYFLHKYDSKEVRVLLSNLKSLNVPFVLECVAPNLDEMQLVKQEIEYLRGL